MFLYHPIAEFSNHISGIDTIKPLQDLYTKSNKNLTVFNNASFFLIITYSIFCRRILIV